MPSGATRLFLGTIDGIEWFNNGGQFTVTAASEGQVGPLASAVLPSSRSVQVGVTATAFATILNGGGSTATGCTISPSTQIPATFLYQTTNPSTNQLIGTPNTPASVPPGPGQSFLIAFTPTSPFGPTDVSLTFVCDNAPAAPVISGLTTLLLSASASPVPDIVAIAASSGGIVNIPGATGTGVFAVATVNVGAAGGLITVQPDTAGVALPVILSVCQTIPATGICIGPAAASVTVQINPGETPTFGIFVGGNGIVPFDPGGNRIRVPFRDQFGVTRGATSVAVRTQ